MFYNLRVKIGIKLLQIANTSIDQKYKLTKGLRIAKFAIMIIPVCYTEELHDFRTGLHNLVKQYSSKD